MPSFGVHDLISGAARRISGAVLIAGILAGLAAPVRADIAWGVNGHPLVSYPGVSFEQQLDLIADLGMRSYRVDVPGTAVLGKLKHLHGLARARGIELLPVITPPFDLDAEAPEVLERKAHDLALALVAPFKGEIRVWELGNELENYAILEPCEKRDDGVTYDCSYGPAGGVSPLDYHGGRWAKVSAVLTGLASGARAADPDVVRAVGTAGWGHTGAFARMRQDAIPWEISVWHMYGGDPEWALKELAQYERPIWITEINAPFGSQKGEDTQVRELAKSVERLRQLRQRYGVQAAHVYELLDEPYWGTNYEAHMGLVRVEKSGASWALGEKKPVYAALKSMIGAAGGVSGAPSATLAAEASEPSEPPLLKVQRTCSLDAARRAADHRPETVVRYVFCLVLGRDADGAGSETYASQMPAHLTAEQLVLVLLNSEEFAARNKTADMSNREFALGLHRLLFGSEMTEGAGPGALSAIDAANASRADYVSALVASEEFRTAHPVLYATLEVPSPPPVRAVTRLPDIRRSCSLNAVKKLESERDQVLYSYCLVLGRWPEAFGLQTWQAAMKSGLGADELLMSLLGSAEFVSKYRVESLSNQDFVTLAYRLLLRRDPDGQGFEGYVDELGRGLDRQEVFAGLIRSEEFRKHRSSHGAYDAGLHRPSRSPPNAQPQER